MWRIFWFAISSTEALHSKAKISLKVRHKLWFMIRHTKMGTEIPINWVCKWLHLEFTHSKIHYALSWYDYEISLVLSGSFFIQSVGNKNLCDLGSFPQFIWINVGFWISRFSLKVATGGIKRIILLRSSLLAYFPGRMNLSTPVSVTYKDQYS